MAAAHADLTAAKNIFSKKREKFLPRYLRFRFTPRREKSAPPGAGSRNQHSPRDCAGVASAINPGALLGGAAEPSAANCSARQASAGCAVRLWRSRSTAPRAGHATRPDLALRIRHATTTGPTIARTAPGVCGRDGARDNRPPISSSGRPPATRDLSEQRCDDQSARVCSSRGIW